MPFKPESRHLPASFCPNFELRITKYSQKKISEANISVHEFRCYFGNMSKHKKLSQINHEEINLETEGDEMRAGQNICRTTRERVKCLKHCRQKWRGIWKMFLIRDGKETLISPFQSLPKNPSQVCLFKLSRTWAKM